MSKLLEQEIIKKLQQMISQARLEHSLGVRDTAADLAEIHGVDCSRARQAGLLHDCAKGISNDNLLQRADEFGIVVDSIVREVPSLLHAPVGAKLAEHKFGVADQAVLRAIKLHTLGAPEMSKLEQIIFIADYIEPHRAISGLEQLRDLAEQDLTTTVQQICDRTLEYHLENHQLIHPQTLATRNAFLRKD
ncbi:MAG: bis(5'-nucleosyl)-tetraphosphatase (symmetrical) YqeK [Bacillota bacterium]